MARRRRAAEIRVGEARSVFLAAMKRFSKTLPGGMVSLAEGSAWM